MDRKEYMREYNKKYRKENKEKTNKFLRINNWKRRGVISDDYYKLHEYYLSIKECENCGIELNQDYSTKKCLDHDHDTGEFLNILCHNCNILKDMPERNVKSGKFI